MARKGVVCSGPEVSTLLAYALLRRLANMCRVKLLGGRSSRARESFGTVTYWIRCAGPAILGCQRSLLAIRGMLRSRAGLAATERRKLRVNSGNLPGGRPVARVCLGVFAHLALQFGTGDLDHVRRRHHLR